MGAGVDHPRRFEPAPHIQKPAPALRLPVGSRRAADVRAFRPGKPQPAEVVDRGGDKLLPAAGGVEILDAEDEPCGAGPRRGDGEGAGMADMEEAGWRRREPAPSPRKRRLPVEGRGGDHISHQAPVAITHAPRARFVPAWARMQSIGWRVDAAIPVTIPNQASAATASAGWVPIA